MLSNISVSYQQPDNKWFVKSPLKDILANKVPKVENLPVVKHSSYRRLAKNQYQFDVYGATDIQAELKKYFTNIPVSMNGSTFSVSVDRKTLRKLCLPLTMYPVFYEPELPPNHIIRTDMRLTVYNTKVYCDIITIEYIVYKKLSNI